MSKGGDGLYVRSITLKIKGKLSLLDKKNIGNIQSFIDLLKHNQGGDKKSIEYTRET